MHRGTYWIGIAAGLLSGAAATCADVVRIGDDEWNRYEWRASTFAVSTQGQADLAVDHDGNITVVWSSRRQQTGQYGVYAQQFALNGVARGSETCLNLWTQSHQWMPAVDAGRLEDPETGTTSAVRWVAWQSHGQDGHAGSIIARRFVGDASAGSELLINQQWEGHQADPVVVVSSDGRALIMWTSVPPGAKRTTIRARLFDASGAPLGDEFAIGGEANVHQPIPGAAFARDGSFAVSYAVRDVASGLPAGIRLQRFDAQGDAVGEVVNVSGEAKLSQIEPVIAAAAGGYVVAWLDAESDGDDYGVLARRFDTKGRPLGEPFVVNETTDGPQTAAAVAVAPDGRFAIAYNSADGDKSGVFARLFAIDGSRIGDEFRLTRQHAGNQAMRGATGTQRLAFAPGGALLCAWSGDAGFGDRSATNVTMLSREALELADAQQGVTDKMKPAVSPTAVAGAEGPGPHVPPTFDPRDVDRAAREIRRGRDDIGFTGVVNTGWTPPDPHLAVGPDHVVVMTNGAIAFFTKDGNLTFQDEIEDSFGFWGSVGATGFVFDPEVLFDELSGRFFAMAAEAYAPGDRSYVLVAVSDDSDPNGTWYKYRFDTSALAGNLFDSPNMGVDANVMYITGDGFGLGSNYPVYTFDKASLLVGNPPAVTQSTTLSTATQSAGIPPVTFDNPPALYMCEHKEASNNTSVRLIALKDPLGSINFTTTELTVPSYGRPEDPPQMGTSTRPETFDARFWSVAYRNGSLWATHHINSSRVQARWYEIEMNGWPDSGQQPSLRQSGTIDPGPDVRTFFTSITVDDHGNAALCYARGAPDEYFSMETAFRYAADPLNTFRPGVIRKTATGPYGYTRWGDYSQINVDPADGKTFWAHHEWSEGDSWRTWVQGFTPEFLPGDVDFDGDVDTSDLLMLLADWGPCPGCPTDLDGDGDVDTADLLALLGNWGGPPA
ncbi:MAG: hypothetical protein SYC29_02470 [Planctomycetota bacterium]|nr:hypothetical protein [Planctomycetota bacterium]